MFNRYLRAPLVEASPSRALSTAHCPTRTLSMAHCPTRASSMADCPTRASSSPHAFSGDLFVQPRKKTKESSFDNWHSYTNRSPLKACGDDEARVGQHVNHLTFLQVIFFLFILLFSINTYAMPEDRHAKLHITADTTIYNYKSGVNYFEGHVIVDQGTTHVTADRLTTKSDTTHRIQEAVAYGISDLAHFWTTPKNGEAVINAKAKIIKFYPITNNTTLQGDVEVMQGQNNFHGQLIHYNMNDQTIIVPETKNGRAVLVYNPE